MNTIKENVLKKMISASNQRLIIPFYHKVSNEKATFSKHLYLPRKINDFKNDIAVLSNYYQPISMNKMIEISTSTNKIKHTCFHLTFDDGLANFYKIVAPILVEKKIPATVFINTDFVDNKDLFYRYKASLLFQVYQKSSEIKKKKFYNFFEVNKGIKEKLFTINFNNKETLDCLAKEINYSFEEYLAIQKPYLTSTQIEALISKGFTIGAHSKNHPLYSDINFEEQIKQTKESINWLVQKFNLQYKVFSFPFNDLGVSTAFFTKLFNEKIVDVSFGTSGIKKDVIATNFHRLFFEIENKNATNYLIEEYLKFFLKIPLNKNTMQRN